MQMTEQNTRVSERTCVGCGKPAAPSALVRLVLALDRVAVDAAGGAFGRGAHVHAAPDCIERACRGGLARAFKRSVSIEPQTLAADIRAAFERRAVGMLLGARRAGYLALGADAAEDAVTAGARLVVLAADAGSLAKRFERAVAQGRAACFGTKAELGRWFGTGETAVFAVRHRGVAEALSRVLAVAASVGSFGQSRRSRGAGER
jgi:predicted RNA-binding protein YlxR (DUF448 family)